MSGVAHAATLQDFYGEFLGHTEVSGERDRDVSVSIHPSPEDNGFYIQWTTVIYQKNRAVSHIKRRADFVPTKNKNVFSSAMSTNVFGRKIPLDPLQGKPYIWARIQGDTLSTFVLSIDDEGEYEFQTYERTLTKAGMQLHYVNMRDNKLYRELDAYLTRVSGQ
ncbi:hypothetical protein ACKC9G_13005 [Pokkaliibacter sp. CJK22405]|uniref:hypothetical protein n=1 Tax=Pokkaliibacter sp. CJK22405 TaxID=3384615 RepID=UPI00398504B8